MRGRTSKLGWEWEEKHVKLGSEWEEKQVYKEANERSRIKHV